MAEKFDWEPVQKGARTQIFMSRARPYVIQGAAGGAAGAVAATATVGTMRGVEVRRRRRRLSSEPPMVRSGLAGDKEDPSSVNKASYEPLKTNMSEHDAKRVVSRVNLAGELPKHYSREQRMGAYEARYVASGGRKGEKYQRRATAATR